MVLRMRAAQVCDPIFLKTNPDTNEQIDTCMLKVLKFDSHPILVAAMVGMKTEQKRYRTTVDAIPPLEQRLVTKIVTKKGRKTTVQVDSFNIAKWWQE